MAHSIASALSPSVSSLVPPTHQVSAVDELSQFLSPHVDMYVQYPTCSIRTTVRPQSTNTCGYCHSVPSIWYGSCQRINLGVRSGAAKAHRKSRFLWWQSHNNEIVRVQAKLQHYNSYTTSHAPKVDPTAHPVKSLSGATNNVVGSKQVMTPLTTATSFSITPILNPTLRLISPCQIDAAQTKLIPFWMTPSIAHIIPR